MKIKIYYHIIVILIILLISISGVNSINILPSSKLANETFNRDIYLGYANVYGNGSHSILEAVAENNLAVGIGSGEVLASFYINYNFNCTGATDSGIISLAISINGQNITPKIITNFSERNGTLRIEDINIKRGDSFTFIIDAIYASIIPFHANETNALGIGVMSKFNIFQNRIINPFTFFLEKLITKSRLFKIGII